MTSEDGLFTVHHMLLM